jgi:hypothetical protein
LLGEACLSGARFDKAMLNQIQLGQQPNIEGHTKGVTDIGLLDDGVLTIAAGAEAIQWACIGDDKAELRQGSIVTLPELVPEGEGTLNYSLSHDNQRIAQCSDLQTISVTQGPMATTSISVVIKLSSNIVSRHIWPSRNPLRVGNTFVTYLADDQQLHVVDISSGVAKEVRAIHIHNDLDLNIGMHEKGQLLDTIAVKIIN